MSPVFTLLGHTHVLAKFVRWLSHCFGWYSPQGMDLKAYWVEALTLGSYPGVEGLGKVRFSPWLRFQTYYHVQDRGVSFCLSDYIFLLIFCRSPSFSLFSVSLHLFPHFLPISTFSFIFCLSPSLSSFSGCLYLYPHFLAVSTFILIFCMSPQR